MYPEMNHQRVLVVDDDEGARALYAELLSQQSLEVVTFPDGQSALEKFSEYHPDLVLMDVRMPKLSGIDACWRLKQDPDSRLVPVILVTGLSDTEDRVRGIEAGADDFLSKPVNRAELLARVRSLLNLKAYTDELERAESVLFALARSIEGKDPYTKGHCERLSSLSSKLGERIGISREEIQALRRAGIVHDIGKVAVPDSILLKPARLTPEERLIMQSHAVIGERICAPLKAFRLVLPIIRHHHEKMDGTGYPDGLRGEHIPLTARILQITDVYDALRTERPYKQALSIEETFEVMQMEVEKGWWDPKLFLQFKAMIQEERIPAESTVEAAELVSHHA